MSWYNNMPASYYTRLREQAELEAEKKRYVVHINGVGYSVDNACYQKFHIFAKRQDSAGFRGLCRAIMKHREVVPL